MRSGRIKIPYDHRSSRLEQPRPKVSVATLDTTQASGEGKVSIFAWVGLCQVSSNRRICYKYMVYFHPRIAQEGEPERFPDIIRNIRAPCIDD